MKRLSVLLTTLVLILASCGFNQNVNEEMGIQPNPSTIQSLATQFTDVGSDYWAREEIAFLYQHNIISGYDDGSFRPGNNVTRAQAAIMIAGALDLDLTERPEPGFLDISQGFHAYDVVAAVADEGIITGRNGRFMPGATLTRGQMAAILQRAFGLTGTWHRDFRDIQTTHPFYNEIQALAENNITTGFTSDNTFRASQGTTRAQFSVFLARALDERFKPEVVESAGELEIHHLNVGQGDSTLFITPNGKTILVDTGTRAAGRVIVEYLKKAGIDTIDQLVLTHAHTDHIGGVIEVMDAFQIRQVVDSGVSHTTNTYLDYLRYVDQNDIPFEVGEVGELLEVDPALTIRIVNSGQEGDTLNNASVSLYVQYNDFDYVITGDAEEAAERRIVDQFSVQADVLRVGHHGSRTSSQPFFLNAVQPQEAILSYGIGNTYGHPHAEVLERLSAAGVTEIYSTTGEAVVVRTEGQSFTITGEEQGMTVEPSPQPTQPTPTDPGPGYPININTADKETLQHITGVGPAIADGIIDYRQRNGGFNSIEEIQQVSGIGEGRFNDMKHQITI